MKGKNQNKIIKENVRLITNDNTKHFCWCVVCYRSTYKSRSVFIVPTYLLSQNINNQVLRHSSARCSMFYSIANTYFINLFYQLEDRPGLQVQTLGTYLFIILYKLISFAGSDRFCYNVKRLSPRFIKENSAKIYREKEKTFQSRIFYFPSGNGIDRQQPN